MSLLYPLGEQPCPQELPGSLGRQEGESSSVSCSPPDKEGYFGGIFGMVGAVSGAGYTHVVPMPGACPVLHTLRIWYGGVGREGVGMGSN